MGLFDKITKLAEKTVNSMEKTANKIADKYNETGFDGLVKGTTDTLTDVGKKTQEYFKAIQETNEKISESIPGKAVEDKLAKAAAIVLNTTQTLVDDAVQVTLNGVDTVSKKIKKEFSESDVTMQSNDSVAESEITKKPVEKVIVKKQKIYSDAQLAEFDCMPTSLVLKHLGAISIDDLSCGNKFKLNSDVIVTADDRWYSFTQLKGGKGSISLLEHNNRVENNLVNNVNQEISQKIHNESIDKLETISNKVEYQKDLSEWIQNEQVKNKETDIKVTKKSQIKADVKATRKRAVKKDIVIKAIEPVEEKTTIKVKKVKANIVKEVVKEDILPKVKVKKLKM
jgi:hypothetical protein